MTTKVLMMHVPERAIIENARSQCHEVLLTHLITPNRTLQRVSTKKDPEFC